MKETVIAVLFVVAFFVADNVTTWDNNRQKERLRCAPKGERVTDGPFQSSVGPTQSWTYWPTRPR